MLEEESLQSGVATVVLDAGQLTRFALGAVDWRGAHAHRHEGSGILVIRWGRHIAIARVGLLWDGLFTYGASVWMLCLYVHGLCVPALVTICERLEKRRRQGWSSVLLRV